MIPEEGIAAVKALEREELADTGPIGGLRVVGGERRETAGFSH